MPGIATEAEMSCRWSSFAVVLVWAFVLLLGGCPDDAQGPQDGAADLSLADGAGDLPGPFPNKPGGNPLVPEVAAYPFPSDFYLVTDSATETGRRISIPKQVLPVLVPPKTVERHDGFSRIPLILAYLPGGVDPTSLPPADDPQKSVAADSPVLLVRQGTHERVPLLAENDLTSSAPTQQALIIRPLTTLAPSTGYVVLLRDTLRDAKGRTHSAGAAFRALRDGIGSADPALERQREDFKAVSAAIAALKLKPEQVVLGWSFHTRSEAQVIDPLVAMQAAAAKATPAGYTIVSDSVDGKNNRRIEATFKAPNFIDPKTLRIALDASGAPVQQGERTVTFGVTIPASVDGPRPVLLFGHGFFKDWKQGITAEVNKLCRNHRFSLVGTNLGFHAATQSMLIAALTSDASKLETVVAEVMQTLVNVTALARLVKLKLAADLTKSTTSGTVKPLDPAQVHYLGASNGATFGMVVGATSPELSRAVLAAGGGGLIHFLQRAVYWSKVKPLVNLLLPDPLQRQLVMSVLQQVLDPVDPMNYAPRLLDDRLPGLQPLAVSMHMAVNDCWVANMVTEWSARSAGVSLVTPSPKAIYGLDTVAAPPPGGAPAATKGALIVYDEQVSAPPTGNVPPPVDNGTHGHVRKLEVYMKHVAAFVEQGRLVQLCDGPCDPG